MRGGVLARAPTLSKRAQTQRRQRRRRWSALLEVVCFSHLFHTHTHSHTRTHAHTLAYPHAYRYKKRDWKCVILLLGQLEATFLGNCQLPQYFNYGLSACVCAHNSICWPNRERQRGSKTERERESNTRAGWLIADLDLSDLLLPKQQLGALPPPAHSLAIILYGPLALSPQCSLYYRLELFINKRSPVSRNMWEQQNIQNLHS